MTQSTEPRPATKTSEQIKGAKGNSSEEAWKLKPELWRFKILEKIIDELSGQCGDTSEDFQKYYAQLFGQQQAGLDCDEEIIILQEYARISGDKQGKNKVQIVQMVEEKAAVFPGAGGLFPAEVEKVGFWKGLFNKVTGAKPE